LIVPVIALRLFALSVDVNVPPSAQEPLLTIDPCVEVDEAMVREVMDLELGAVRGGDETRPAAVFVRCVADGEEIRQEIRIEPRISGDPGEARTIRLTSADGTLPVTRAARSRELALAISEIIRRRATAPAPSAAPPPEAVAQVPPAVSAIPSVAASPPAAVEEVPSHWQLGISPTYDYFDGGQRFAGGDLFVGSRLGRWLLAEARAGGRVASERAVPGGSVSVRATTAGVAVGVAYWPERRPVGAALMLRAEEYWVQFHVVLDDGRARTALLGAFVLAAEPRLIVAMTRQVAIEATSGIGFLPHGIVVRTQGMQTQSVSGLYVSASLAGVLSF
jgi:hypothetical protein